MTWFAQTTSDMPAWTETAFEWGIKALPTILSALAILIIGLWLAARAGAVTRRLLKNQDTIDVILQGILARLVRYAISIIVLIAALGQLGVQTTSLLAALGAIGLAIGLALQGTLSNIAAGMMLLWLRPYKVGDYIKAGDIEGTVNDMSLFATHLKTIEGLFLFAPNNELWNTKILNYSKMPQRMIREIFTISYDDDIGRARRVLQDLFGDDERVLQSPEPVVYVVELGDSAVGLEVRAWTKTTDYAQTRWSMIEQSKVSLEAAGISIPYPQQDVHIRAIPTPESPSV